MSTNHSITEFDYFNTPPETLERMVIIAAQQLEQEGDILDGDFDEHPSVIAKVNLIAEIQKQPWHDQQGLTTELVSSWVRNAIKVRLYGGDAQLKLVGPTAKKSTPVKAVPVKKARGGPQKD